MPCQIIFVGILSLKRIRSHQDLCITPGISCGCKNPPTTYKCPNQIRIGDDFGDCDDNDMIINLEYNNFCEVCFNSHGSDSGAFESVRIKYGNELDMVLENNNGKNRKVCYKPICKWDNQTLIDKDGSEYQPRPKNYSVGEKICPANSKKWKVCSEEDWIDLEISCYAKKNIVKMLMENILIYVKM